MVMSAITHFYHLAALDYVSVSNSIVHGQSPWAPQHTSPDMIPGGILVGPAPGYDLRDQLVSNYVEALTIRRKCHVAATLVDGKHPCQNAQVPGGFTTKPSTVDWARVVALCGEIRAFIGAKYLPDVITAACAYGGVPPVLGPRSLFLDGYGCGRALAYGCCPNPYSNVPLVRDGVVTSTGPYPTGLLGWGGAVRGANEQYITEDVTSGYYTSANNLHPSVGQTVPGYKSGAYTWHKAPRYNGNPCEVGPLARMLVETARDQVLSQPGTTVTDNDLAAIMTAIYGTTGRTIECATNPGYASHFNPATFGGTLAIPAIGPLANYTAGALIIAALNALTTTLGLGPTNPGNILSQGTLTLSTLGRHGARALEAKYFMDAIAGGATVPGGTLVGPGIPYINAVRIDPAPGSEVYTYVPMAKSLRMGRGLTEAPRGALGHWMTSEFRRVVNYQCVVPSTWNACGRDAAGVPGPIEQSFMGNHPTYPLATRLFTGYPTLSGPLYASADTVVNRILKAVHPYDICIACSVHVTDTKGTTIAKLRLDPDGKITKIEEPVEA